MSLVRHRPQVRGKYTHTYIQVHEYYTYNVRTPLRGFLSIDTYIVHIALLCRSTCTCTYMRKGEEKGGRKGCSIGQCTLLPVCIAVYGVPY